MSSTPPVRVRSDLYDWLSTEASTLGISVPAVINSLVEREATLGRMFLVRPMIVAPGMADASKELEEAPRGQRLMLAYNDGRTPWGWLVAGTKTAMDTTTIDVEVFSGGRIMRLPRHFIFAWHICDTTDFGQQILTAAFRYREFGVQLHPAVMLANREAHGV